MSTGTLERIETPRLHCERIRPENASELEPLLLDPRVARTLWPQQRPPTAEELHSSLASRSAHWDAFGFGLWILRDRTTGEVVGRGGLQHTDVADVHAVEAGWAIVPHRWGQGLATELAHEAVDLGFNVLGLQTIVAFTLPHNVASLRVMEKTGFEYQREVEHVGLPHVLYRTFRARNRMHAPVSETHAHSPNLQVPGFNRHAQAPARQTPRRAPHPRRLARAACRS